MAGNHLEDLVAQWYQFQGYFVRRKVQVGKRLRGGYECELDVVAFQPAERRLIHIEPSLDSDSWERREERYRKNLNEFQLPQFLKSFLCFAHCSSLRSIGVYQLRMHPRL